MVPTDPKETSPDAEIIDTGIKLYAHLEREIPASLLADSPGRRIALSDGVYLYPNGRFEGAD